VCQRFSCPTSEYEERVFRECLYWHAKPFAPILRLLRPSFFAEDFKFIQYLGASTGFREATADLLNYHDANVGRTSFLRSTLKIRVSGRKASNLAQELFAADREANLATT
jgi:hypothetical protein